MGDHAGLELPERTEKNERGLVGCHFPTCSLQDTWDVRLARADKVQIFTTVLRKNVDSVGFEPTTSCRRFDAKHAR